ncbi:MAG TPA: transposase [Candidatus Angelobacter sp.]
MTFYRRNLPHIDKPGSTFYVTFGTKREFVLPEEARSLVFDHCLFENSRTVRLHACVVMPDHVHMLFTPLQRDQERWYTLAKIMNGIKGASAHSVNKLLKRTGALWEPESFDRIVRTDGGYSKWKLHIIGNPIAAGLSRLPGEYKWCWQE